MKHIFNAGPSLLPRTVLQEASEALLDFEGSGVSVLSLSHRSKEWGDVMDETRALWKELLKIPDDYEVVFLHGGAAMCFLYVAMNFLEKKAAYIDSGVWAGKALKEARLLGDAYALASSSDRNYSYIPRGYDIPSDIDYLHITTNNTIYGTELREDLDSPVPLIADMSSDILSRPVDVEKYAMIYGGAQKNAGTAGVAFAIVKKSALGKVSRALPTMMDLRNHISNASMTNTPPVFGIYIMNRTLHWIKEQGGVEVLEKRNALKAGLLYDHIDSSRLFYGTAQKDDRSMMNVTFRLREEYASLEQEFLSLCDSRSLVGVKGHRYVGGFRASIYNACTLEDVEELVSCMKDFENLTLCK